MLKSLLRLAARYTPTIAKGYAVHVPTIAPAAVSRPTIAGHVRDARGVAQTAIRADRIPKSIPVDAPTAAAAFVRWATQHGLAREWQVDSVWFLAVTDFAAAHGLALPPRRVFLGALQRQPGVKVTYDRRVRSRDGRVLGKSTFYSLPSDTDVTTGPPTGIEHACAPMQAIRESGRRPCTCSRRAAA